MRTEVVTFPRGAAEGYLALAVERGDAPFESGPALAEVGQILESGAHGLWAIWLRDPDRWDDHEVIATVEGLLALPSEPTVVGLRQLGAEDWPPGPAWVLDASEALRECEDERATAHWLGARAHHHPLVEDLVIDLEADRLPPTPGMLSMLAEAVRPTAGCYLYLPRDYLYRALLLRHVSLAWPLWAVRTIR